MQALERAYSTFDIVKIFGIKRDRLQDWLMKGYIEPSIERADGIGTRNRFDLWDLYHIALFLYFLDRGFSREVSALWSKEFRASAERDDRSGLGAAPYIGIFRGTGEDGDSKVAVVQCSWDEMEEIPVIPRLHLPKGYEFDDIIIVNFQKLRDRVDEACEQLV